MAVDPALSLKRSIAGKRGAEARWGQRMANHGPDQPQHTLTRGGNTGYRMANATTTGGRALIDIHGEIGVWGIDASTFIADLRDITGAEIELHISSPGGDVFDGIAIYQALLDHPAHIDVMVDSLAGSIASVIAQAGDWIRIGGNGQFMIHDAIGGVFGNATEMRHMADLLDMASNNIASIYADRSGNDTVKKWRDRMTDGVDGTWYTADEAVAVGLADEVVKAGARSADPKAMWRESLTRNLVARTLNQSTAGDGVEPPTDPVTTGGAPDELEAPGGAEDPEPAEAAPSADLAGSGVDIGAVIRDALDPPDQPATWDPYIIRAAIEQAANNAPANNTPPPDPTPETTLDEIMTGVAQRFRETLQ
jgi:ATP-dependent protease ClpP protease subunit